MLLNVLKKHYPCNVSYLVTPAFSYNKLEKHTRCFRTDKCGSGKEE